MRIVSLSPFITEVLDYFELLPHVVGLDQESLKIVDAKKFPKPPALVSAPNIPCDWSEHAPNSAALRDLAPEVVLSSPPPEKLIPSDKLKSLVAAAQAGLSSEMGRPVMLRCYAPTTLNEIFSCFEEIGKDVGCEGKGIDIRHLLEAQFKDWYDNFYDRMKRKRVTFLSSIRPFKLAGKWIPDLIKMASCIDQHQHSGEPDREVSWEEIVSFRPDVIIVAPRGATLEESYRTFFTLEKEKDWEQIPAVKRGEVVFCEGSSFYRPGLSLRRGMGIICSALAGLDSGYITPRDSFQRLRWLELQRHRFKGA